MKSLLMGLACTAMLMGSPVLAQQQDKDKSQDKNQQAQKGQQQTITGTIAGVTAMGEMVIDPQSRRAVVVEADYLAVLGSPSQGPSFQADENDQNQAGNKKDKQRQNLYFVALTPKTKVHWANQKAKQNQKTSQKEGDENESALEDLEIGDRVQVQFDRTEQLHAKSEGSKTGETRTAGFRGDKNAKKHGRDRIFVGQASDISILSAPMNESGQNQKQNKNKDKTKSKE